ncbi:YncE family protein [Aneurinibacillus sp. REN35]|uniref:YncE family protein n=1 Tax=Aneurinibacillus sp. REN35 TaxID=3237286 RepID=UPI0035289691
MRKKRLAFVMMMLIWIMAAGCQSAALTKVPRDASVLAVANARDNTISFMSIETGEMLAAWKPAFPFDRMLLLPDHHTVLLYGKNGEDARMLNMNSGKEDAVWKTGGGIVNAVLAPDGDAVYLADKQHGSVRMYTLDGNQTSEIKVGPSPFTMIPDLARNRLYVMDLQDAKLREIDLSTKQVVRTSQLNESPMGALLAADRKELWVGGHGRGDLPEQEVSVFSSETGQKKTTVHAPSMPVDFVRIDKDTVYVLSHGSNMLRRINMENGRVTGELALGANPFGMVHDGRYLYIASYESNQIVVVDPKTMRIVKTLRTGDGPIQMFVREGEGK